jgi:hypothetical protein
VSDLATTRAMMRVEWVAAMSPRATAATGGPVRLYSSLVHKLI